MSEPPRITRCPACRKVLRWSIENPHRPFCSARCQTLDLGDWASERLRIPGEPLPEPPNADNDAGTD